MSSKEVWLDNGRIQFSDRAYLEYNRWRRVNNVVEDTKESRKLFCRHKAESIRMRNERNKRLEDARAK